MGQWEFLCKMFKVKGPTFEKIIMGYLKIVVNQLCNVFVSNVKEQ